MRAGGRNDFLFVTARGAYFVLKQTRFQSERSRIQPLTMDEARAAYEQLTEHEVGYEKAFPGVQLEDA